MPETGAMASAAFGFAGATVRIDGPAAIVGLATAVLRHHERPVPAAASVVLRCVPGRSTAVLDRHDDVWRWEVPPEITLRGPDWFYYYGFARVLHRIWDELGFVRLHGALVWSAACGGLLVVGDRHDGKSSVAAGWLDQGGMVATDDTVLLDVDRSPVRASGLLREMHVERDMAPRLRRLTGVADGEPYLPGRSRVRYEWVSRFPAQVIRSPIAIGAVIRTRVCGDRPTSASSVPPASREDVARVAFEARQPGGTGRDQIAWRWLTQLPTWDVTWGMDLWSGNGGHPGYVRDHLKTGR